MEDLPLLIRHFLAVHGRKLERRLEGVAPAALEALRRYSFPGNVRELSHMIERAVALAAGPLIEAPDLPEVVRRGETPSLPAAGAPAPTTSPLKEAVDTLEHEQILEALRQADWNISRAAQRLGISRNTLRYRMEKFHLKP
jgi:two-component system response regulator HydG